MSKTVDNEENVLARDFKKTKAVGAKLLGIVTKPLKSGLNLSRELLKTTTNQVVSDAIEFKNGLQEFREAPVSKKLTTIAVVAGISAAALAAQYIPEAVSVTSTVLQDKLNNSPDIITSVPDVVTSALEFGKNMTSESTMQDSYAKTFARETGGVIKDVTSVCAATTAFATSVLTVIGFTKNRAER